MPKYTPYLYKHQNPHAPRRANGVKMWAYPTRIGDRPPYFITAHTAENLPDFKGEDLGAEAVARYFSQTSRPASAHENIDSDSHVVLLPPMATAFAAINYNSGGWHFEMCTQAHRWATLPEDWKEELLERSARRAGRIAYKFSIDVRLRSRRDIDRRIKGFTSHSLLDPDRRSDPGEDFPWKRFLRLVRQDVRLRERRAH